MSGQRVDGNAEVKTKPGLTLGARRAGLAIALSLAKAIAASNRI
jgi:hypothetical protein